jgi:hypothetical protein
MSVQTRYGRVTTLKLVTKSVAALSYHDRTNYRHLAAATPLPTVSSMMRKVYGKTLVLGLRAAASIRRFTLPRTTGIGIPASGTIPLK